MRLDLNMHSLNKCHPAWQRFVNELLIQYPNQGPNGLTNEIINKELKIYQGEFFEEDPNFWVDFSNELRYNLFILKFV